MVAVAETVGRRRLVLVVDFVVVVRGVSKGKVAVSFALQISVGLFVLHFGLFVEE